MSIHTFSKQVARSIILTALLLPQGILAQSTTLKIVDSDAKPVTEAHVSAVIGSVEGSAITIDGNTDSQGRFVVPRPISGIDAIWVTPPGGRSALEWRSNGPTSLRAVNGVVLLQVPQSRIVRLHVVDPAGKSVSGASIEANPYWFDHSLGNSEQILLRETGYFETDVEGRVEAPLSLDRYWIRTSHGDLADQWLLVESGPGPIESTIHVRNGNQGPVDGRVVRVRVATSFPTNSDTIVRIVPIVYTASRTATHGLVAVVNRSASGRMGRVDINGTAVINDVLPMPSIVHVSSPGCRPSCSVLPADASELAVTLTAAPLITGIIVDTDGRRVFGADIELHRHQFIDDVVLIKSDAVGRFETPIDTETTVSLTARHALHGAAFEGPHVVGTRDAFLRLVVTPRSRLSGVVKTIDDVLVPSALVWVHCERTSQIWRSKTDEKGRFNFSDLPHGNYSVASIARERESLVHVTLPSHSAQELSLLLSNQATHLLNVDVVDDVTGDSVAGAFAILDELRLHDSLHVNTECSGSDGRLRCPRPRFGSARVRIVAPGYIGYDIIGVTYDSPMETIVVRLKKGVTVLVRLRNSDGGMLQPRVDRIDSSGWPREWDKLGVDDGYGGLRLLNVPGFSDPTTLYSVTSLATDPFGFVEIADVAPGPLRIFVGTNLGNPLSPRLKVDIEIPEQPRMPIDVRLPW